MKNKHITWTSVDDLIALLEAEKARMGGDGTMPVCVDGISDVDVWCKEYYYDGGYCAPDVNDRNNVLSSKHRRKDGITGKAEGFHAHCICIRGHGDDYDMSVDGRPVVEIDPENWLWYDQLQQAERVLFDGQTVKYQLQKERNKEMNCYPFKAYVDSGEFALGGNMYDAKEALLAIYKAKNGR